MEYQLSLFDTIEEFSPLRRVAEYAEPRRIGSFDRIQADADAGSWDEFVRRVREEYCPHGFSGAYGIDRKRPDVKGYDFTPGKVSVKWIDRTETMHEERFTWSQFAKVVLEEIASGNLPKNEN